MTAPPTLETARTVMAGPALADFEASAAMWGTPAVVRHITGKPLSRAEAWARLLRQIGHWRAMGFGYWVVRDKATGAFLGEVGFAENRREITPSIEGLPEAGWALAPDAQRRGVATEAITAALG